MKIGHFTFDPETNEYAGELSTLSIPGRKLLFRPLKKIAENEPDYRVVCVLAEATVVEVGAAWIRVTKRGGKEFLSVALDDPALSGTLNAALFVERDGVTAHLEWERPRRPTRTTA
jgi:uncharacterized protein (DUF736 family)